MFDKEIDTICFSGGGTKGLVFVGAIKALVEKNVIDLNKINKYIGTSAGSVIALLLLIGYTPEELECFLYEFNFNILEPEIDSDNLFLGYGIDDGSKVIFVFQNLLEHKLKKKYITFAELFEITGKEIIITATSISKSKIKYFNHISEPDLDVVLAVRMSMSVPFYYMPVSYKDEIYIDGGILDNYPIQLGEKDKTIGIVVASDNDISIKDFTEYMIATIRLTLNANLLTKIKDYEDCTISIVCGGDSFLDFSMEKDKKKDLFDQGFNEVMKMYNKYVNIKINEVLDDILIKVSDRISINRSLNLKEEINNIDILLKTENDESENDKTII